MKKIYLIITLICVVLVGGCGNGKIKGEWSVVGSQYIDLDGNIMNLEAIDLGEKGMLPIMGAIYWFDEECIIASVGDEVGCTYKIDNSSLTLCLEEGGIIDFEYEFEGDNLILTTSFQQQMQSDGTSLSDEYIIKLVKVD